MDGKKAVSPRARKLSPNKKENKNNEKMKRESKAAYGRYENVLLTDDEKSALQTDFPDWQERIYDRVLERCVPLRINNQNIRELNRAANFAQTKAILTGSKENKPE